MRAKLFVQSFLNKFGIEIHRYPNSDIRRRMTVIQTKNITSIIDVGANSGQYALEMRRYGYSGKIISFEPLVDAFRVLSKNSSSDDKWEVNNFALGEVGGNAFINVAGNSFSSSILDMLDSTSEYAPDLGYVDRQPIVVKRLTISL